MDLGQNGFAIIGDPLVRKAQDPIALAIQPLRSGCIVGLRFRRIVKRPIDLDDQSAFVVHEVGDEPRLRVMRRRLRSGQFPRGVDDVETSLTGDC